MVNREPKNNQFIQVLNDNFDSLLIMAMIMILVAAFFLLIRPKYQSTITAIKDNISQQEKLYNDKKSLLSSLKTAAASYEAIKKDQLGDVRKVNAVLPNEYVSERLFGEVEEIISKNGFILSSLNINKEALSAANKAQDPFGGNLPTGVGVVRISAAIGAIDYAGLKNLLFVLENNNRLLDVSQVSFSPTGKTANLEMITYYFKP